MSAPSPAAYARALCEVGVDTRHSDSPGVAHRFRSLPGATRVGKGSARLGKGPARVRRAAHEELVRWVREQAHDSALR